MAFWKKKSTPPVSADHKPAPTVPAAPVASRAVPAGLTEVGAVIAIASGKGGVGKSTVSANLAVALGVQGHTVALMDADIYGPSQSGMFGTAGRQAQAPDGSIQPVESHGVRFLSMSHLMPTDAPVVWRAPMAVKMIQQFLGGVRWGARDYLLIDLPPGTGDVQLTLAQQASLSGAVIVTTPQEVAVGVAKKGLKMFQQMNVPILGIIENMSGFACGSCGHVTRIFDEGGGARLARESGVPYLGALPLDPEIMQSGERGEPVLVKTRDSSAAKAILQVATNLKAALQSLQGEKGTEPKSVNLESPTSLKLDWPDGKASVLSARSLRLSCGCANCVDENTGRRTLDPSRVPLDVSIQAVQPVGRYALTARFSDGHSTGIFPYKNLRELGEKSGRAEAPSFTV